MKKIFFWLFVLVFLIIQGSAVFADVCTTVADCVNVEQAFHRNYSCMYSSLVPSWGCTCTGQQDIENASGTDHPYLPCNSNSSNSGAGSNSSNQTYCGDGVCNGSESCSSCSSDCGSCSNNSGSSNSNNSGSNSSNSSNYCSIPDGSSFENNCDCDEDSDCPSGYHCEESSGADACIGFSGNYENTQRSGVEWISGDSKSGEFSCGLVPKTQDACYTKNKSVAYAPILFCSAFSQVCLNATKYAGYGAAAIGTTMFAILNMNSLTFSYQSIPEFKDKWVPGQLNLHYNKHKYQLKDLFLGVPSPSDYDKRCRESYKNSSKTFNDSQSGNLVKFEQYNSKYGLLTAIVKTGQNAGKMVSCFKRSISDFLKNIGKTQRYQEIKKL